jgi:hypothetical protein
VTSSTRLTPDYNTGILALLVICSIRLFDFGNLIWNHTP